MNAQPYISIDQNSHPLWDAVPKLQALHHHGWSGTHCVEDIDVAFTLHGADAADTELRLARECVYRGGVSDWGAALFYTDFLGRQPLDVRRVEPYVGWSLAALSRRLQCTVDELYARHSVSDNWQLVGPSYCGDDRHHRVVGDLSVAETQPFIEALLEHARADMTARFPDPSSRARARAWCEKETARVQALVAHCEGGRLVDLYKAWMGAHLPPNTRVTVTSAELARDDATAARQPLLQAFVDDYPTMAASYNAAVDATDCGVNPLNRRRGELPFFVVLRRDGHLVRTPLWWQDENLVAGDQSWPVPVEHGQRRLPDWDAAADVVCVAGKALLLVLQVRLGSRARALALPHRGSLYMPAAHAFAADLVERGTIHAPQRPVVRVTFDFIARCAGCDTRVCLPEYLHAPFGAAELGASDLAEAVPAAMQRARSELDRLRTEPGREALVREWFGAEARRRSALDARRRELARTPEGRPQAGALWDEIKAIDRRLLQALLEQVVQRLRVLDLEMCNSRGALLPWALALGGEPFYERLLAGARLRADPPAASAAPAP